MHQFLNQMTEQPSYAKHPQKILKVLNECLQVKQLVYSFLVNENNLTLVLEDPLKQANTKHPLNSVEN